MESKNVVFWVTTGEAVVGCRDANWACGNSAITNILLLSAVWVVGDVFADQNAPGTRPES